MRRVIFSITFISFCLAGLGISAQETEVSLNSKEALSLGKRIIIGIYNIAVKAPWNIVKWIWGKIWQLVKILSEKIKSIFSKEIEKPEIKEEFKKETEELKEIFPGKSIWEKVSK